MVRLCLLVMFTGYGGRVTVVVVVIDAVTKLRLLYWICFCYGNIGYKITVLSLLWLCFCYGNIGYKITVGPPNRGVGKGL